MILDDEELVPLDAQIHHLGQPRGPAIDALNAALQREGDDVKLIWIIAPLAAAGMYLLIRRRAGAPGSSSSSSSGGTVAVPPSGGFADAQAQIRGGSPAGGETPPPADVGSSSHTAPPHPQGVIRTAWTRADLAALVNRIAAEELYHRPELVHGIIAVESSWNPNAINRADSPPRDAIDPGDSIGLMQIKLATARPFVPWVSSIDGLLDPQTNVTAGIRFLATLERKWGAEYGIAGVIQMYNLGETRFRAGERSTAYLGKVQKAIAAFKLPTRSP